MKNKKASFIPNWDNLVKFFLDPKADWKPKVAIGLAILYIIWPLDLIPDIAPILGWLDDIGFTFFVTAYLFRSIDKYVGVSEDLNLKKIKDVKKISVNKAKNEVDDNK